ncbi:cold-shock protein [Paenibacillus thiaminolyticus]|uniref:cold-shock protein n=1 Tax=Paenibacillus thiaminolyticus TaxID=49283 RepID=UPI00232AF27E|nr:cold-shock protein [Paenibacillus thiaminolyticus]WCF08579.1 cold-shock protein [Paenibacillus thiaminolyticus]WII37839.1 cold-shock protein [Paenibacillus thiaminolyticus]
MNYRKKPVEEIPVENTAIWSCMNEDCNGWMRDNFAFDLEPTCPMCSSAMARDMKMLPLLVNTNGDSKSKKSDE